jgi:hypothetical protein|tara:strand:- start:302 stop:481 length:180 start_codon:yes stop_codon:yes gene_type:complete
MRDIPKLTTRIEKLDAILKTLYILEGQAKKLDEHELAKMIADAQDKAMGLIADSKLDVS